MFIDLVIVCCSWDGGANTRTGKDDLTQKKKINIAKNCHCRK